MTTTDTIRRPAAATMLTLLLALLLALTAACGDSGDGGDDLPTAGDGTAAADDPSDDPSAEPSVNREDAMLKFAECMREHGVDMPDPGPDGRVMMKGGDPETMRAAEEACSELREAAMPEGLERPEISEEQKQAFLDMAQCMRDKGYDFEDPQFDGGGVRQRMNEDSGIDPEDPTFQADMEECQSEAGVDMPDGEDRHEG